MANSLNFTLVPKTDLFHGIQLCIFYRTPSCKVYNMCLYNLTTGGILLNDDLFGVKDLAAHLKKTWVGIIWMRNLSAAAEFSCTSMKSTEALLRYSEDNDSRMGAIFLQGMQVRAPRSMTVGFPEERDCRTDVSVAEGSSAWAAPASEKVMAKAVTNFFMDFPL